MTAEPPVNLVDSHDLPDSHWYSQAGATSSNGRLIYTSGQTAQRKDGTWPETFEEQVAQAVINLKHVLAAAGSTPRDIVKLTFYVVDWDLQSMGMSLYQELMTGLLHTGCGTPYRPLTTLVPVPKLASEEIKFEIEAIARTGGSSRPWTSDSSRIVRPVPDMYTDVVVVGAGFSGLMAARELKDAGLQTMVLEARDRIGGRSWTSSLESGSGKVELGATWINKTTQPTIYGLVQKFSLETADQHTAGLTVLQTADGQVRRSNSWEACLGNNYTALMMALMKDAESRDIHSASCFATDEDVSFLIWAESKGISGVGLELTNHISRALVGREAHEVGAQYLLDYIKSGHGIESLGSEGDYGAQSLKIKSGTTSIAENLAAGLDRDSILLESPVHSITQYDESGSYPCLVKTTAGHIIRAKKVIMANPTNTYRDIRFNPPLPRAKRALVCRTMPGIYAKVVLVYSQPWWRDAGLCGKFESFKGPICFSWDSSTDDQFSLALFIAGERAVRWHCLSPLAREEAIVDHLTELAGSDLCSKAQDVLEVQIAEWTKEAYIGGGPTSAIGPNVLRENGEVLRLAFNNIHIAGGEAAFEWKGYLEGALTSGQRAAREIISILGRPAGPFI